jgi:hypothetical protein
MTPPPCQALPNTAVMAMSDAPTSPCTHKRGAKLAVSV